MTTLVSTRNVPRELDAAERAGDLFDGIESCFARGVRPAVLTSSDERHGFYHAFHERTTDLVDPVPPYLAGHQSVNVKSQFLLLTGAIAHRVRHLGVDLAVLQDPMSSDDGRTKEHSRVVGETISGYRDLLVHVAREHSAVERVTRDRIVDELMHHLHGAFDLAARIVPRGAVSTAR